MSDSCSRQEQEKRERWQDSLQDEDTRNYEQIDREMDP